MGVIGLRLEADLQRLSATMAGAHGKAQRAIAQGLNEGGDKVRTQVRRAMREQTGLVRLQSVTKRQRTIKAFVGGSPSFFDFRAQGMRYVIIFAGKPPTKPDEFRYSVKRGPGGGVTISMWGAPHRFKRSFQMPGSSGASGLRMRLGRERFPIRSFDGPNLAKEAVKGKVAATFLGLAPVLVPPMIEKRLARALA